MCALEEIKETLIQHIQEEVNCIECANYLELGAAVDMVKDLAQAIYYHKMAENMNTKSSEETK